MPNRIIKESICTSENLNNLSLEEEVFFYRLITQCDDFGRMDARPQILRAKCFPLRTDTIHQHDVESWLQALVRENLITIYTVDGKNIPPNGHLGQAPAEASKKEQIPCTR